MKDDSVEILFQFCFVFPLQKVTMSSSHIVSIALSLNYPSNISSADYGIAHPLEIMIPIRPSPTIRSVLTGTLIRHAISLVRFTDFPWQPIDHGTESEK